MQDTSNSGQFDSAWHFLFNLFAATGAFKVSLLLYGTRTGIYINLFLLSVYTLSRRRKSHGKNFLLGASCVIAVVATTEMGCNIAQTILTARLVQQLVNAQVWDRPHLVKALKTAQYSLLGINKWLYRCYVIWGYQRKILILPVMFMLTTFVGGIWAAPTPDAIKAQIVYSLLESGAIYCVGIIFLLVSSSVKEFDVFLIGLGFISQLLNIIPTFTLVYIGLTDTTDKSHPESDRKTSSPAVRPRQPTQVLDIKPQGMEEGDYV
ncbi:hypothetical protein DFH08DRAFT_819109 [Mycena albidolilacea]|uniref:Uncharacterized protein n=1 Tax=Mycena albidolilacea TaxID=1033008 RepID=A0AAD6ZGI1_9AGAR|nr:hypothetical protein DFH08DRAFT_819109 [Mycena albidolilacea]